MLIVIDYHDTLFIKKGRVNSNSRIQLALMKIRAYGSKLCNNKFTWCFHKAKQVCCLLTPFELYNQRVDTIKRDR